MTYPISRKTFLVSLSYVIYIAGLLTGDYSLSALGGFLAGILAWHVVVFL